MSKAATDSKPGYAERLQARVQKIAPVLDQVRAAIIKELDRYQFNDREPAIREALVNEELRLDSYDGGESYFGEWRTPTGALLGYTLIHQNGQVYAEFDVVAAHPFDRRWFIEAITAWGDERGIHAEPQMLPALGD